MSTPAVTPAEQYARFRDRQADPEFADFRSRYDFEFDQFQVAACGALTAGDGVLVHVARVLQQVARTSDLLGRYDGDEFGLILPGNTNDGAVAFADRARDAIAKDPPLDPAGAPITIHLSAGIAVYPDDGDRAGIVVQAADRALYQAKRRGRDQVIRAQDID